METVERTVSAADLFTGSLSGDLPHGFGKYVWADGGSYEGDWLNGVRTGRGTYVFPSGSTYEGEWLAGRMQGTGTYTSGDGTRYEGAWQNDLKHGLGEACVRLVRGARAEQPDSPAGKKRFPNGDVYQGLWRAGQPFGPGMYKARPLALSLPCRT